MMMTIPRSRASRVIAMATCALMLLVGAVVALATTAQAAGRSTHEGNLVVREDGAEISNLDVNGSVIIYADNVTLRNVTVTYQGYHSIRVKSGAEGTRIYDTVVNCAGSRTNGIVFGGYYAENVTLNDCRNGFMSSPDNPATVVNGMFNGVPVNPTGPTPEPTVEPTTEPTVEPTTEPTVEPTTEPTTEPTVEPTTEPTVEPTTEPSTGPITGNETFPTLASTGPASTPTTTISSIKTSQDGQVIEGVAVNGRITVRHDNVTIRDTVVNGTGTYMIFVIAKDDGSCPSNVQIERVAIDGSNAPANSIPIYGRGCGFTLTDSSITNIGRGVRTASNTTLDGNYINLTRTWDGAHRAAISSHGGENLTFVNNAISCENTGCSATITLYGDYAPIDGVLVQNNLMATTGAYCMYGGSVGSKDYPDGSNVRILDNHFSTRLAPNCGTSGIVAGFDDGVRGNQFTGNVWHETGAPALRR